MKKEARIRSRRDFVRISESGFYYRTPTIVVQARLNSLDIFRVGFTATKRIGNAVVRNRCKRRMRAAADIVVPQVGVCGIDYVFIARKKLFSVAWISLLDDLKSSIQYLNRKILKCKNLQ